MSNCIYKPLLVIAFTGFSFSSVASAYNSDDSVGHNVPLLQIAATPGQGKGIEVTVEKGIALSYNPQMLLEKLTKTPEKLLLDCISFEHEWLNPKNEYLASDLSFINFPWFQRACKQNPIGLLGECTLKHCPPNRLEHPELRKKLEDDVTDKIVDYLQNKDSVTITELGCGGLFQTLVLVSKLNKKLIAKGEHKTINLNLIDIQYTKELLEHLPLFRIIKADIFDYTNEKRGYWLRYNMYRMVQFLMPFQNQGNLKHNVRLYSSAYDYCTDVSSDKSLATDFLLGIDIVNDEMGIRFAAPAFGMLFENTLKNGGFFCLLNGQQSDCIRKKRFFHTPLLKAINLVITSPLKVVAGIMTSIAAGIWGYRRWHRSNV